MAIGGGFNVRRGATRDALPQPEFLSRPISDYEIDSVVLNANGVAADSSGPYINRRYMVAGTILSKRGDGQYEEFTAASGQAVAGLLFQTVEFADGTDKSDQPVALVPKTHVGHFKTTGIKNYATHSAALIAAFTLSNFKTY